MLFLPVGGWSLYVVAVASAADWRAHALGLEMIIEFAIFVTSIVAQSVLAALATRRYLREENRHSVQWFGVCMIWLLLVTPVLAASGVVAFAIQEFGGNLFACLSQTEVSAGYPLILELIALNWVVYFSLTLLGVATIFLWRADLWYWQSIAGFITSWPAQMFAMAFYAGD